LTQNVQVRQVDKSDSPAGCHVFAWLMLSAWYYGESLSCFSCFSATAWRTRVAPDFGPLHGTGFAAWTSSLYGQALEPARAAKSRRERNERM